MSAPTYQPLGRIRARASELLVKTPMSLLGGNGYRRFQLKGIVGALGTTVNVLSIAMTDLGAECWMDVPTQEAAAEGKPRNATRRFVIPHGDIASWLPTDDSVPDPVETTSPPTPAKVK